MKESPLHSLHAGAGARFAPGTSSELLLTYGDVPGEYAAALGGAVLFDRTELGRVAVSGGDRADFLHRILSSEVRALRPGQGGRSLLLTSKGKVLFDLDLDVEPERVLLSCGPGRQEALIEALERYHFAEAVEIADASEGWAPMALAGPARLETLVRVLPGIEAAEGGAAVTADFAGRPVGVASLPVAGSPGLRVDAGPAAAAGLWAALREAGARPAGRVVWDILRVEAGAAEAGVDVDDTIYPQEARLESAFSLDKGCYVGQEVVAKIETYGGLNKRLVGLRIDHDDPVPAGTRLRREQGAEWRDLGVVTSWSYSFALDTGMALGYVKRRHQAEGTRFRLGETEAEAEVVRIPVRAEAVPVTGEFE